SLNPQKLAGQCAKLKCCMNYELDTYVEASRAFPAKDITLETTDATYYQIKCDLLKRKSPTLLPKIPSAIRRPSPPTALGKSSN
ncbi:MAG: hypothetical protein J6U81_07880, partial [Bacteroidales bacterium]|nr:hypothetical protein [Bacteroidales bacterium]